MAPTEKRVDWDFVLPCFKTWEMALVEALTWVVPVAETGLYWYLVRPPSLPPSLPSSPSCPPHQARHSDTHISLLPQNFSPTPSLTTPPSLQVNMHFAMWHVYSSTLWIYITLCINSLTHYDGTPEPEPVNGRHKVRRPPSLPPSLPWVCVCVGLCVFLLPSLPPSLPPSLLIVTTSSSPSF
jgi:hypothetical protein